MGRDTLYNVRKTVPTAAQCLPVGEKSGLGARACCYAKGGVYVFQGSGKAPRALPGVPGVRSVDLCVGGSAGYLPCTCRNLSLQRWGCGDPEVLSDNCGLQPCPLAPLRGIR